MKKAVSGSGFILCIASTGAAFAQAAAAPEPAPAPATAASGSAAGADTLSTVIITGTRQLGLRAVDSAAPVQVLDAGTIARTGQLDLVQGLAQNLPSFTAQATGGDQANLTLSARLRGLSANNTLVLINGKRRHTTGNLAVLNGPYQGSAGADLNFIPVSAIDHIEVLQDGAAAQYGTDAIAGVVNIILKRNDHGGSLGLGGGAYFDGGGGTANASGNLGLKLGPSGFLNLSAEAKTHDHSDRGGIDPNVIDPGNLAATPQLKDAPGYPYVNHVFGDAKYRLGTLAMNGGLDISDAVQLYTFATYGNKYGESFENYRLPSKIPSVYPLGFSPQETLRESDYAFTVGAKGRLGQGWNWDLASTYGRDDIKVGVIDSANVALFNDTGSTPTDFKAGGFRATQWTNNLDISREFEVGLAAPLNLAFGAEHRAETYAISAGDPASRYGEGSQSYPGFLTTDAGEHRRTDRAAYIDVAANVTPSWLLDAAARVEHYSDFGNTSVGKLTSRYDVTPAFAVRGTVSTGFRAPTLAEGFYSATNVSTTSAFVQLPPNSAGAKLVGVDGLRPEKSKNFSLGFVANPARNLSASLDVYQITIRDRIVASGTVFGSGGAVNSPAVVAAIAANGNTLDPSVSQTGINIFTNAVDTRSRGLDLLVTYNATYEALGRVDWTLAGNYNQVKVTRINQSPTQILPQVLMTPVAISDIETAAPRYRINLGALWKRGQWSVNLRETLYGPSSELGSEDGATFYRTRISPKLITDLEVGCEITPGLTLSVGANNLFNTYPNKVNPDLLAAQAAASDNLAVNIYPSFSPFGINGGYYYAKLAYKF